MTGYWRCPFCGAILEKGAGAAAEATPAGPSSAQDGASVECPHCGAPISAQELANGLYDAPEPRASPSPPAAPEPQPEVTCPKCQARNAIDRMRCTHCGAPLLPGRRMRERVAYLVGGPVLAAVFVGLAVLFSRLKQAPPCLASPLTLIVLAVGAIVGGIRAGVGRTPAFERHVTRAEKNLKSAPELALADLTLALELAPERKRAEILRQRGEVLAGLGRKEEAVADLARYATHPQAHGSAKVVSQVIGVDLGEAAAASTEHTLDALRNDLIRQGSLTALGYCQHCRQGYVLGEGRACPNCGRAIAEPRFVQAGDAETQLAQLRQEGDAAWKARRRGRIVTIIIVGLFVLCAGAGLIIALVGQHKGAGAATPTKAAIAAAETLFSFTCPSDWKPITPKDVDILLETSLEGLQSGTLTHIGGCYYQGVEDCRGCAKIVSAVALVPGMPGTLNDEQYQRVRALTEQQMGSRLESFRRIEAGSMPGVESIHVGKSHKTKLWDLIIVPPRPGVLYMVSACSDVDAWGQFEPMFAQAVASLKFTGAAGVAPTRTATPKSTPRPPPTMPAAPTVRPKLPASPAPPTPQPSPAAVGFGLVTAEALNVRSGPGSTYGSVAVLKAGDPVQIIARTEAGNWLLVICPNEVQGWVSAGYVDLKLPLESVPVAATTPAAAP